MLLRDITPTGTQYVNRLSSSVAENCHQHQMEFTSSFTSPCRILGARRRNKPCCIPHTAKSQTRTTWRRLFWTHCSEMTLVSGMAVRKSGGRARVRLRFLWTLKGNMVNTDAMIKLCDSCGRPIERTESQFNVRGFTRNFCSVRCVGDYRRTQTGKDAGRYVHGGKGTRLYRVWKCMKSRCLNPKASSYHRYGGRGIGVCSEWVNSFVAFRAWALANGYRESLTLDRINNDGGYSPANCRFATVAANRHNSSTFRRTPAIASAVMMLKRCGESYPSIAKKLRISKSTVFRIVSGHGLK
jgi:hypothetical protein